MQVVLKLEPFKVPRLQAAYSPNQCPESICVCSISYLPRLTSGAQGLRSMFLGRRFVFGECSGPFHSNGTGLPQLAFNIEWFIAHGCTNCSYVPNAIIQRPTVLRSRRQYARQKGRQFNSIKIFVKRKNRLASSLLVQQDEPTPRFHFYHKKTIKRWQAAGILVGFDIRKLEIGEHRLSVLKNSTSMKLHQHHWSTVPHRTWVVPIKLARPSRKKWKVHIEVGFSSGYHTSNNILKVLEE